MSQYRTPLSGPELIRAFRLITFAFGMMPILLCIFARPVLASTEHAFELWQLAFLVPQFAAAPMVLLAGGSGQRPEAGALIGYGLAEMGVLLAIFLSAPTGLLAAALILFYLDLVLIYSTSIQRIRSQG